MSKGGQAHLRQIVLLGSLCGLLALPVRSEAQVAVIDVANLARNTWTSIQSTITAVQAVILVADSATNLLGLDSSGLGSLVPHLRELGALMGETNALLWDIQVIEFHMTALFGFENAPEGTAAARDRMNEILRRKAEILVAAMRLQAIWAAAQDAVVRIENIIGHVMEILGNKQGQQRIAGALTELNATQARAGVTVAAFQQAVMTDMQEGPLKDRMLSNITNLVILDWPE